LSTTEKDFKYNVFIDLDKTLLSVDSGTVLAKKAHKEGLMRTRDLLNGLYLVFLYKMEWRDTRLIINAMAMWMKGIQESLFADFANRIAMDFLTPMIRPQMREEILRHKEAGARIVMLSASLDYVCIPIAEYSGFDVTICSTLEVKNGIFTGHPNGHLCFGKEKLHRIMKFYDKNPSDPGLDYYYADSFSDAYVMRKVGHPVAVEPDRHLKRYARNKGWEILL
jgi:HAD superfamily hydrolase (TIGR01490 family)